MERSKMILLDTHIWYWLLAGDERIEKSGFLKVINKAIKNSELQIAAITLWELAMMESRGRISLTGNIKSWIDEALAKSNVGVCPISPEIAVDSCNLPGDFHGDPADRMIVATARALDAKLLTFDKEILKYAKAGFVRVRARESG